MRATLDRLDSSRLHLERLDLTAEQGTRSMQATPGGLRAELTEAVATALGRLTAGPGGA
jgi:hypothetical protein